MPMHPASLYPDIIYLNFTLISNATNEIYDAKIEVYQIQISANTGLMERYICFFGTNYNTSYSNPNFLTPSISYIDQLVDTSNARITGIFSPNMLTGQSLWFKVGSLDTTTSKSNGLGLWSAGEPNSITVSIQRIGWIALNGTSSSIISPSPLDSVQAQISLPKLDEGFQFNAITQNEMSKDADVFHPIDLYNLTP
jgi:hypothetical protein